MLETPGEVSSVDGETEHKVVVRPIFSFGNLMLRALRIKFDIFV